LMEDMNVTSTFYGMAEFVQKMRTLVNFKPFQNKMDAAKKKYLRKRLNEQIHAIQTTRTLSKSDLEHFVATIGNKNARNVLSALPIFAVQGTSFLSIFSESNLKYFFKYRLFSKSSVADIMENWMLAKHRQSGYSAMSSIANPLNSRKIFIGRGSIGDESMSPLHMVDMATIKNVGRVVRAEMADKRLGGKALRWWTKYGVNPSSLEYGSDEYWKAFNDRADYIAVRTQPMFEAESRNEWMQSENVLVRDYARFRTFIDQLMRIPGRKISLYSQGEIPLREAAVDVGIASVAVFVLGNLIMSGIKKALGDKREFKDMAVSALLSPISSMPFVGYPMKQMAETAIGQPSYTPEISTITLAMLNSILKHAHDVARAMSYMMNDEMIMYGENRGQWKSDVYMKRGLSGAAEDALILNGFPVKGVQQINWFEE